MNKLIQKYTVIQTVIEKADIWQMNSSEYTINGQQKPLKFSFITYTFITPN